MALEGSIKDFSLADILQLIHLQKKTGILTMKNASMQAKVLFENGMVITASQSDIDGLGKIGEILTRSGRISEEQLKQAVQSQRQTKEKIGIILVNMGAISKEDLIKALDLQVKETLFGLFKWKEGQYSFNPLNISYEHDYWQPMNTEFILMEAIRRVDEWPLIEKKLPNQQIVFAKNEENEGKIKGVKSEEDSGGSKPLDDIYLTQDEMSVYNLVDGQQDVRHLIEIGQLGEFDTCKALSNLLAADLIVQKAGTQPQTAHAQKAKAAAKPSDRSLIRTVISGLVLVFMIILSAMTFGKWNNVVQIGEIISGLYKNALLQQQYRQIAYSIETFYYRNNQLPESLETLIKEGYLEPHSLLDPWGREILYNKQNDGMEFSLESKTR